MEIYRKIRDENVIKYGTDSARIMHIIIDQYSDRTHFLYEILQNAEDADATRIFFRLFRDRLEVFHNGRPFNEKDIVGVCGIADGTKNDGTRIGHFGIGFKSVYSYTETPEIYSGGYNFRIINQIFPEKIRNRDDIQSNETGIVIPFNKEKVRSNIAFREIGEALKKKVTAESIIMLNHIKSLSFQIEGEPEKTTIELVKNSLDDGAGNVFALSLYTSKNDTKSGRIHEIDSNYLFFTDANQEACSVVYKLDDNNNLEKIRNSKIYAFFPTAKEAHQGFYIHAPFDTTPARDNFKQGEDYGKHNIYLIGKICELINFSFGWMRDNDYLSFEGFTSVFPIYEYDEGDVLYPLYRNSIDYIRSGEWIIPANQKNVFKKISEIAMPSNMEIATVFDDDDLQKLTGNNRLFWINKGIQRNVYNDMKLFLTTNFDIKTYEWRDLVLKMDASFLKKKRVDWIEELMSDIQSTCIKRGPKDSHYINVEGIPWIRLTNGEHITAKGADGRQQVYSNNPDFCDFRIHADYLKNQGIVSFLVTILGVNKFDAYTQAKDYILPKYMTSNVKFNSNNPTKENIEDLRLIRDAIQMYPSFIDTLAEYYIVTDGDGWYRPTEMHIPPEGIGDKKTGYLLVKDVINIKYLSARYFDDSYMDINLDRRFFQKIGCSYGLKLLRVSEDKYLSTVNRYCGRDSATIVKKKIFSKSYVSEKIKWNLCFEGFTEIFREMSYQKSLDIAKFLNAQTQKFDIAGDIVGADDKDFSGKNVDTVFMYTMLGVLLCFEKWIYITSDDAPHCVTEVDKADLRPEYEVAKRLIDMLPFKEVKNAMTEWVEATITDKNSQNIVKNLMNNPEQLIQIAEMKAKIDAKAAAKENKTSSVKELLKAGDVLQTAEENHGRDPEEVHPISEKALSRREEKIQEEFRESLDNFVAVNRSLSFTTRKSSEQERAFLEGQYDGYCQICNNEITKHDGKPYFEAINIIKFSGLDEKLEGTASLGWNSICLCPNCAAKYNYASKVISDMYEQVLKSEIEPGSDVPIQIHIQLMGEPVSIKYSPRHLLAMQTVFRETEKETV